MLSSLKYFYFVAVLLMLACADDPPLIDPVESNPDDTNTPDTTIVDPPDTLSQSTKINGLSFVSPPNEFPEEFMSYVESAVSGDWIAISPFGFSYNNNDPQVLFNTEGQWWGETGEGVTTISSYARSNNLKVMIKPQVWIPSGGWVGEYDALTEEGWTAWEKDYRDFILYYAELAQELDSEIFCIGTEYKIAAIRRQNFWFNLIDEVRAIYDGELVYASNWDHYQNIGFWTELDYIGVDSYFPLVEASTPKVSDLLAAWQPISQDLEAISNQYDKQILFTEYGYLSVDGAGWQNWVLESQLDATPINMQAQVNCFEAFYQQFWDKDWVAGGFIWKWYHNYIASGGITNRDYTPQNKPVESVISNYYD